VEKKQMGPDITFCPTIAAQLKSPEHKENPVDTAVSPRSALQGAFSPEYQPRCIDEERFSHHIMQSGVREMKIRAC